MTDARTERLRVACGLLAPPAPKDGGVRVPLGPAAGLTAIRGLTEIERDALSGHIDWVLEYEAHDFPEKGRRA